MSQVGCVPNFRREREGTTSKNALSNLQRKFGRRRKIHLPLVTSCGNLMVHSDYRTQMPYLGGLGYGRLLWFFGSHSANMPRHFMPWRLQPQSPFSSPSAGVAFRGPFCPFFPAKSSQGSQSPLAVLFSIIPVDQKWQFSARQFTPARTPPPGFLFLPHFRLRARSHYVHYLTFQ